jgi:hypothetical protein
LIDIANAWHYAGMGAITDQLPTIVGVIVGAAGTIAATGVADLTRWRRQLNTRWDDKRLQTYVDANAVKELHAYALRLSAIDLANSRLHRIDRQEGLAKLAESDLRRTKAWESVLLLGNAETVNAAREWRDAVYQIELLGRGLADKSLDLETAVIDANSRRDDFYRAARASLGIKGGMVTQADWLANSLSGQVRMVDGAPASPEGD